MTNKLFGLVLLSVLSPAALAQGYVGAVAALTRVDVSCLPGVSCDNNGFGFKLFAGTKLEKPLLKLGGGGVDVVEVAAMRLAKGRYNGRTEITVNGGSGPVVANVPASVTLGVNGLVASLGASFPLGQRFAVTPKLGVAYMTATGEYVVDGARMGSVTKSSVQPYLGVSADYLLGQGIKLTAGLDWTRFRLAGSENEDAMLLGLGAAVSF